MIIKGVGAVLGPGAAAKAGKCILEASLVMC